MLKSLLIAGMGGFIGSSMRYAVSRYVHLSFDSAFPWGTLVVNILGSFLIGALIGISEKGNLISPEWNVFLAVGICGGFTTFSAITSDSLMLLQNREVFRFTAYAGLSFFLGLTAVFLGRLIMKSI